MFPTVTQTTHAKTGHTIIHLNIPPNPCPSATMGSHEFIEEIEYRPSSSSSSILYPLPEPGFYKYFVWFKTRSKRRSKPATAPQFTDAEGLRLREEEGGVPLYAGADADGFDVYGGGVSLALGDASDRPWVGRDGNGFGWSQHGEGQGVINGEESWGAGGGKGAGERNENSTTTHEASILTRSGSGNGVEIDVMGSSTCSNNKEIKPAYDDDMQWASSSGSNEHKRKDIMLMGCEWDCCKVSYITVGRGWQVVRDGKGVR